MNDLVDIIARNAGREGALLPILHDLQAEFGCIDGQAEATFDRDPDQSRLYGDLRTRQHAVIGLHPRLAVEADLGQVRQTIGIVRIRLVRHDVEGGLRMARIDADRRHAPRHQRMIDRRRQGIGLEDDPFRTRRMLADRFGNERRVGLALAARRRQCTNNQRRPFAWVGRLVGK